MSDRLSFGQPKVFKLSVFTSAFERISYYILAYLFVLYATMVFKFSDSSAFMLFGVFTSFTYVSPAIGGYLADRVLGIRRCMIFGLILSGIGYGLISIQNFQIFSIGTSLVILGVGFYKTTPTHILARAYNEGDPRIDSGFTLYYMGMNLGVICCSVLAGTLQQVFGFSAAFTASAISLLFALGSYFLFRSFAEKEEVAVGRVPLSFKKIAGLILGVILGSLLFSVLMLHLVAAYAFFLLVAVLVVFYIFYEIMLSKGGERKRISAALLLIFLGMTFYIFYFQIFTSIVLFIERIVERKVNGYVLPTAFFMSLNPFWVTVLSPILAIVYKKLGKRDFSVIGKFCIGLAVISLSFSILPLSIHLMGDAGKISYWWIVFVFALISFSELLVAALGVAMITKIAPKRLYGFMMGAWYLIATGGASLISGLYARVASVPEGITDLHSILKIYSAAFLKLSFIGIVITIVAIILAPFIKRLSSAE